MVSRAKVFIGFLALKNKDVSFDVAVSQHELVIRKGLSWSDIDLFNY